MITITVRQFGPDRRLRLNVPLDVPVSELLGDFIDAAEDHAFEHQLEFEDSDGWRLQLPDGSPPNGECLDELGIRELALYDEYRAEPPYTPQENDAPDQGSSHSHESAPHSEGGQPLAPPEPDPPTPAARPKRAARPKPAPRAKHPARTKSAVPPKPGARPKPAVRAQPATEPASDAPRQRQSLSRGRSSQRIVRARAEEALPRRMGVAARTLQALSALSPSYNIQEAEDLDVNNPARFTRAYRKSALGRMREAWWSTDYERLLDTMIVLPAPPVCQTVAVLSPKGGVGKTTITGLLGMLLAYVRRTVTVAVDANPDMSNLSAVLSPGRGKLIDELLQSSLADGRSSTPMAVLGELGNGPHGIRVAPSPNDPERALKKESYLTLYKRLKAIAEVLVLDCGTGLFDDPAQAAIETADQLVVVVDGAPETMNMVAAQECQRLLRSFDGPIFLVVNKLTRRVRRQVNLGEFERELAFAQGIVEVAYDEKAAASLSTFRWDDRPPADWAVRTRELAALITTTWPTT